MENINRINIYVGKVGTAYVDKETALKKLNAALKNIEDMKNILADARTAETNAQEARDNADAAKAHAQEIANLLDQTLGSVEEGDPKYELLVALYNELQANDNDGNGFNGGNVVTAELNYDEIIKQLQKIGVIITEINDYLDEAKPGRLIALRDQYQTEYDEANEIFNSMIPEEVQDENDISDQIERNLIERIEIVNTAISDANTITQAINDTSNEVTSRIDMIMGSIEPVEQFTVRFAIENGIVSGSEEQLVNAGSTVRWEVTPNEGFRLPSTVTNGTINGNVVTSKVITEDTTVTVICEAIVNPEPTQYTVTLVIQNGETNDEQVKTVNAGETASWEIIPTEGYEMPSYANNGTINGNTVTSNPVNSNMVVTVVCKLIGQEDTSYYVYFGDTEPTADNLASLSGVFFETLSEKPSWEESNPATFTTENRVDKCWIAMPLAWGDLNIYAEGSPFPSSYSDSDLDTEEILNNITINGVEYAVRQISLISLCTYILFY